VCVCEFVCVLALFEIVNQENFESQPKYFSVSVSLSVSLSLCLFVCLYICIFASDFLSLCVSVFLSISSLLAQLSLHFRCSFSSNTNGSYIHSVASLPSPPPPTSTPPHSPHTLSTHTDCRQGHAASQTLRVLQTEIQRSFHKRL